VQVGTDTDWVQAYAGQSFFLARKKDGTWWGCGGNDRGQLGFNSNHRSVGSPQKLPWNFEPWALGAGFGNTLLLTQDGNLWTWGERLGSEKRGTQGNFRQLLNRLTTFVHGGGGAIAGPPPTIDKTPYLIWTLPAETRASLEKEKTP
jgi:alpha-tubulin suppressor-like RCC1 family protein